jgi:zinc/manganese transport system substrate-binding protein
MTTMRCTLRLLPILLAPLVADRPAAAAEIKVVTTLPSYASIARLVGGERVAAEAISRPDEDAHFVKPKPSLALMLKDADLFVTTGLDLEVWAPALVDKSGNRKIRDGQPGFVAASQGVHMLEVPSSTSRSAGDIHIYGNPHIHTSPINAKVIATNIVAGLTRIDPAAREIYAANLEAFKHRIDVALYGDALVELLGSEVLDPLAEKGTLLPFLEGRSYSGKPLVDRLGGWLGHALPYRDRRLIAYHKNWAYFAALFGLEIVDYVEPKPGIPPSARHVFDLIQEIEHGGIDVLLSATYFEASKPRAIADRTGCRVVLVPLEPGGAGPADYFALIDDWVSDLATAFAQGS